jgi:8-oxo-dGTP pyrophosphatase MutT (NUDIX family)
MMSTTAIFAEIIVVGLQTAAWIALLVLAIFGAGWIDLNEVENWVAVVTLLVFAGAYMLGVLTDRAADSFALWLSRSFPRRREYDKPAGLDQMRLHLLREDNAASKFVDYQRSRMRIARATGFNLLILAPVLAAFLTQRTDAAWGVVTVAVVATVLAAVCAFLALLRTESAFIRVLSEAYRGVEGIPEPDIAAAVCYRWKDGRLEFCVVETSDGNRWTFPKGHRCVDESLPEAARREAREEAGIIGRVYGQRLHTYRFPASREGLTDDDVVAAYLLQAERFELPKEARRQHWCGAAELREYLARAREGRYVKAIDPVINRAVRAAERQCP